MIIELYFYNKAYIPNSQNTTNHFSKAHKNHAPKTENPLIICGLQRHSRQENQQTEVRTQELKMTKTKQQSANKLWLCTKQIWLKNYGFGIYSASGFSSSLFT